MSAGFGCSSDSSMISFGSPLRIYRFPPSLIQPVLYIVHVHRHQWYLGLLDWIVYSCPGRYSLLQSLLMFGAEFVPRSVVLSPVYNVHRPGRQHRNADALSRIPCRQCGFDPNWENTENLAQHVRNIQERETQEVDEVLSGVFHIGLVIGVRPAVLV